MVFAHALYWFLLGMLAASVVLSLWHTRDLLRDSASKKRPKNDSDDGNE